MKWYKFIVIFILLRYFYFISFFFVQQKQQYNRTQSLSIRSVYVYDKRRGAPHICLSSIERLMGGVVRYNFFFFRRKHKHILEWISKGNFSKLNQSKNVCSLCVWGTRKVLFFIPNIYSFVQARESTTTT